MVVSFVLLATFPRWHSELNDSGSEVDVRAFPLQSVSQAALAVMSIAAILMLVSVLWQHVATATAASMGGGLAYGAVRGGVGVVAMVLGWGGVLLVVLGVLGLLTMILTLRILTETGV